MSSRLWLILFLLTAAIGISIWMSGERSKPYVEGTDSIGAEAPKIEPHRRQLQPDQPDPEQYVAPTAKPTPKPTDNFGSPPAQKAEVLPGPGDSQPPAASQAPSVPPNTNAYPPPPVDAGAGGYPPPAYPPPAYPPPAYPDGGGGAGGFEGDIPPPNVGEGEFNPDDNAPPPGGEGF